jgi:hypothetical protein
VASSALRPAAVGFRAHSGWAAAIALAGPLAAPEVVARRRVLLAAEGDGVAKQPFHAAEELEYAAAERLIRRCTADSARRAHKALAALRAALVADGLDLVACAVLGKATRPLPPLRAILGSHALIHAAEGELFREVLREAARATDVTLVEVGERDALGACVRATRQPEGALTARLGSIGKALGPPWQQDHKLAALAAWSALAAVSPALG